MIKKNTLCAISTCFIGLTKINIMMMKKNIYYAFSFPTIWMQNQNRPFCKNSCHKFPMEKPNQEQTIELLENKKKLLNNKIEQLEQKISDDKFEIDLAQGAYAALIKKEIKQVPTRDEKNCLNDLKKEHPEFFSGKSTNTLSEDKEIVLNIIDALDKRIVKNQTRSSTAVTRLNETNASIGSISNNIAVTKEEYTTEVEKDSTSESNLMYDCSNKQTKTLTPLNDYIDNLPRDHNPFDDLGDD